MRYREFAGKQASVLALGTMDFGGKIPEGMAFDCLDAYAEMGGNNIDTARVYGDFVSGKQGGSEEVIGRWLERRGAREKIVLGTKGAHPPVEDMHHGRLSREEIEGDIQKSLEALRTDFVDIYWLHRDDENRPVADILETLNGLIDRGWTRVLGASNWSIERIREANDYACKHGLAGFAANQPQFSLAKQVVCHDDTLKQMDARTWEFHRKTGLKCFAFSSQAKGFYTKLEQLGEAGLSPKARERFYFPENTDRLAELKKLSSETGYSVNALCILYLTSQPFEVYPILGYSRLEQLLSAKEAADGQLTREQVLRLKPEWVW